MVLSYTGKVLSGSVPYSLPPMPFVPGTNAIARVVEAGSNVTHVQNGDRVFLSPHLRGDVPGPRAAADPDRPHRNGADAGDTGAAGALARRRVRGSGALAGGLRHAARRPRRQTGDRADRIGKADRAVWRAAAQWLARRADHHHQRRHRLFRLRRGDAGGGDGRRPRGRGRAQAGRAGSRCARPLARASFRRSSAARRRTICRSSATRPAAAPTSRWIFWVPPRARRPRCPACARSSAAAGWC